MSRLVLALLCLYLAVALCPEPPHEFPHGYDRSYLLALSAAHAQDVVFGEQLNYPYGPLGWLWHPLPISGAVGAGVAVQLTMLALFIAVLAGLARRVQGAGLAAWCLVVIGAAGLIDPEALWLTQLEFSVPVVGLLAFATPAARRLPVLLLLAVLAATLLLVKLDGGVYAIVVCAALCVHAAWERRAEAPAARRLLLLPPLVFLLTLGLFFRLESGPLDALPVYLRNAVPVLVGYKEMSIDGPPANLVPPLVALGVTFILLPLLVRDRRRLLPALLILALPVFMLWQRVAMRQDAGHQVSFLPRLATLLLFPLLAVPSKRDRSILIVFQVVLLVSGEVVVRSQKENHVRTLVERASGRQALTTVKALAGWDETLRALEAEGDSNGAPLRLGAEARRIVGDGAVDSVPSEIERVMAHGWRWAPRPALQSSNAYMPALDGLDAGHFAGDAAPPFVLASLQAIDGRHAFFEAPLTWRALLDHYDLRASYPAVLLLQRRTVPRLLPPRLIGEVRAGWDHWQRVPEHEGLLLLSCRIDPGLAGSVAGLFYRTAAVHLDARYRSGLQLRLRVVRSNLASGAIVDPLPSYLDSLRTLLQAGPGATDRVVALRLHTDEPWQFEDPLEVQWWELPVAPGQLPWRSEQPAPEPPSTAWTMLGEDCDDGHGLVLRLAGKPRLGQAVEVVMLGAPPGGVVFLLVGGNAVALRRASSTLFVNPSKMLELVAVADAGGVARLSLAIPAQPELADQKFTIQAAATGEAGGRPSLRLSCGFEVIVGR